MFSFNALEQLVIGWYAIDLPLNLSSIIIVAIIMLFFILIFMGLMFFSINIFTKFIKRSLFAPLIIFERNKNELYICIE